MNCSFMFRAECVAWEEGLRWPTSLRCPALPPLPLKTNGFNFRKGAWKDQPMHYITVTQNTVESGWCCSWMCRALEQHLSPTSYFCSSRVCLCCVVRQFCAFELLLLIFDWLIGMRLCFEAPHAGKRAVHVCVATLLSPDRTGGRTAGGIISESIMQ